MNKTPEKYKPKETSLTVRIPESSKELFGRIGYGSYSRGVMIALEYYQENNVIPKR